MKRPFALLGSVALFTLMAALCLGRDISTALSAVCAVLGGCALLARLVLRSKRGKLPGRKALGAFSVIAAAFLTAAVFFLLFVRAFHKEVSPALTLDGKEVNIRGTVRDYPEEQYHKYYYLVDVRLVNGRKISFTARISSGTPVDCEPGDSLDCRVTFFSFDSSGGLYSTRNTRLARGAAIGGYVSDYQNFWVIPDQSSSFSELAARLRNLLGGVFRQSLPEREAGLLQAILLGERSRLDEGNYGDFRRVGASHLLVISGLHMTAIAAALRFFARRFRLGRRGQSAFCAGGILLFLFLLGFPSSAVRGGVMYLLYLGADTLGRRADGLNSLGAAVFLICLFSPFSGGDVGLLLSALAVLGLHTAGGRFYRLLAGPAPGPLRKSTARSLGSSFAVLLFTLPVQVFAFGGFSILAPIATLILAPPCILLVYLGAPAAVLGLFPVTAPLAEALVFGAGWSARISLAAARALSSLPGFFLDMTQPVWVVALGMTLILLGLLRLGNRSRPVASVALCCIFFLWTFAGALEYGRFSQVVTLTAMKDSSCVLVEKNGRAVLLSLEGFRTSAPADLLFKKNIRKLEAVFLPERSPDAREAAFSVLRAFPDAPLYLPEGGYVGKDLASASQNGEISFLRDGQAVDVLDGVTVTAEQKMRRLVLEVYNFRVILDADGAGADSCHVLFTSQEKTGIDSAFTVLQNCDIMESGSDSITEKTLSSFFIPLVESNATVESGSDSIADSGIYLLPGENGLSLDLHPQGWMELRGESVCQK